jgi:small-conductance mechanosensitive channel
MTPLTRLARLACAGLLVAAALTLPAGIAAQEPAARTAGTDPDPRMAPVVIDGRTLFFVAGTPSYPAEERAQLIAGRIQAASTDPAVDPRALRIEEGPDYTAVFAGSVRLLIVTDADTLASGAGHAAVAPFVAAKIGAAIVAYREDRRPEVLTRHAGRMAGWAVLLVAVLWAIGRLLIRLRSRIQQRFAQRVEGMEARSFSLIRARHMWRLLAAAIKGLWIVTAAVGGFLFLEAALAGFPWTRALGVRLGAIVLSPVRTMAQALLDFVPDLAFLIVLGLVTRYALRLIRLFFDGLADGRIHVENFDPDWAGPTYRLVRLGVLALAIIVAYPYIPGSDSAAFKGVSVFIGVVFSLGSSSIIGNTLAGYSMTYRRAFRVGDRIKIGDHVGTVEKIRLTVTHLRTLKNEELVVPNSIILSSEVVNYSAKAKTDGLILHTTVGIGYETPWRQVEAMLLEAARRVPDFLATPGPFVMQKGLGDFAVTYEINAYCDDALAMPRLYTALHQSILDVFNQYGVQIMTPAYEGDPEQPKVVAREDWYTAPARPPSA